MFSTKVAFDAKVIVPNVRLDLPANRVGDDLYGKDEETVIVCASTECFPDLPREEIPPTLVELQYSDVEIPISDTRQGWIRPSEVVDHLDTAVDKCRNMHRLHGVALSFDPQPPFGERARTSDQYYEQFAACAKLAKALKVVPIVIPSAELGTPFNEEIERLRELVKIASLEGALVAMRTQIGSMTEDPDTAVVLCDNVRGLGLTLDPSHYIAGPRQGQDYSKVLPYVYHVRLRDTTKAQLQVRVGKGEVDYGRLITDLQQIGYRGALCVCMTPMDGFDHKAEMRKIRLLLESML